MPEYVRLALMKAYRGMPSHSRPGWWVIWDDKANEWLANHLGIHTGPQEEHTLSNSFIVRFDWAIQRYYLR